MKLQVARRLLGDGDDAGNAGNAVGMFLKRRIPEILRIMLLAGGEVDVGRARVAAKASEKATFTAVPSGRLPSRSNRITLGVGDRGGAEIRLIGARVAPFQHKQSTGPRRAQGNRG